MLITHRTGDAGRVEEIADIRLTRGTHGGEIAVRCCGGLLTLTFRIGHSMKSTANISVDYDMLYQSSIKELGRASRVMRVLGGAFEGCQVELNLVDFDEFDEAPIRFRWEATSPESMAEQTFPLRAAMALAHIAQSQGLTVDGAPMSTASKRDMDMWLRGEQFLRTGKTDLPARAFFVSSMGQLSLGERDTAFGNVLASHHFEVPLAGEVLAELPAWVHFRNFHARIEAPTDGGPWYVRFTPGENATREFLPPSDERPEI